MKSRPRLAGLWLALGLGGCSATGVLAGLTATPAVKATRDIAYAPGPRHELDVYQPRAAGPHPVVVFIYGGSWDSGSRTDYRFVGQTLAARGFVAIVPDYRVYPEVRYPAFLQDNALAVAWAKAHAADYGGDPRRLFLMGHSAGAYEAVMLSVDRRWLGAVGLDPRRDVAGTIGLAGPYDFLPLHSDELKIIFGPEQGRPDTQPINHVDGMAPPLLLITDGKDKVVDPGNTPRMAARVRERGGQVRTIVYPGLSHQLLIGAMAAPLSFLAPVAHDVGAFIDASAGAP
jgi:acetyl esterase/lipase